jgi:hypothetical protein
MPALAKNAVFTPIPVQLSETEFNQFILPHLSMPKRGPKCKLGYYRVFNLILWVLYTGMQWKCLPVPKDRDDKAEIHYTTVYKVFAKWADDGPLSTPSLPVWGICRIITDSISTSCMATAPTR